MTRKILVFSDMYWERKLRKIKDTYVESFSEKRLELAKNRGINRYFSMIKKEKPDLVLFAGDITGDGTCGHGFLNAMKILLKLLDKHKIQSYFISGNHDEFLPYTQLTDYASTLTYSEDISNKLIEYEGIKILGIPFDTSYTKTALRACLNSNTEKIDIVLAHAEHRRRALLFDLDTDYIITGHFDRKLVSIEKKIFISLDNDSGQETSYSVLSLNPFGKSSVLLKVDSSRQKIEIRGVVEKMHLAENPIISINDEVIVPDIKQKIIYEEVLKAFPNSTWEKYRELIFRKNLGYILGENLRTGIERIRAVKNKKELLSEKELEYLLGLHFTEFRRLSKAMILDYAGKRFTRK